MEALKSIFASSRCSLIFFGLLFLFASAMSSSQAKTHEHEFVIQATPVKRLCKTQNAITVNGQYPAQPWK
ncbi:hypothetical protein SLA2020_404230 [Shorea laevis]